MIYSVYPKPTDPKKYRTEQERRTGMIRLYFSLEERRHVPTRVSDRQEIRWTKTNGIAAGDSAMIVEKNPETCRQTQVGFDADGTYITADLEQCLLANQPPQIFTNLEITITSVTIKDAMVFPSQESYVYFEHRSARATLSLSGKQWEPQRLWYDLDLRADNFEDAVALVRGIRDGSLKATTSWDKPVEVPSAAAKMIRVRRQPSPASDTQTFSATLINSDIPPQSGASGYEAIGRLMLGYPSRFGLEFDLT